MKISAVSTQDFTGKRDNINKFISLSDEEIQRYAFMKAAEKNKKRQRNSNRMFYSVPLVAGIAAAALTKGKSTFLANEVSGKAAKLANAVKNGGYWAFLLGTAITGAAINNKIEKNSSSYRNFRQNHPMLSFIGDLGTFFAATTAIPVLASAAYGKLKPEHIATINRGVENISGHINNLKAPNFIKNIGEKISKHIPDAIKGLTDVKTPKIVSDTGKTLLAYAPHITVLSAFFNSLGNRAKFMRDADQVYADVREKQQRLVRARLAELES